MSIHAKLMQKNGFIALKLARELMTVKTGDRIGTVQEYSQKYGTGRGTVQSAFKLLCSYNAIQLEPHGHLGTFVSDIDYKILWDFTGFGTIMGVMPLPYSKLYEGLATGLYKVLKKRNIPFSLAYMRGSVPRLDALVNGHYDFVITSHLAAQHAIKQGTEIDIVLNFGKGTYVTQHATVFSKASYNKIEDGMRIGVDYSSIDHYLLTLAECKNRNVIFKEMAYNQLIPKLQNGQIDAAVWNVDEIIERKISLKYIPVDAGIFQDFDTEAVLVVGKDNFGINNLLSAFISPGKVTNYQRQVVSNRIVPNY